MENLDALIEDAVSGAGDSLPTDVSAPESVGDYDRGGYQWADDCYWVWQHLGEKPAKKKAGSAGRLAMWNYANKNIDEYVGKIMPRAMAILEKARDKTDDEEAIVQAEEKKDIAAMQRLLKRAVAEATGE